MNRLDLAGRGVHRHTHDTSIVPNGGQAIDERVRLAAQRSPQDVAVRDGMARGDDRLGRSDHLPGGDDLGGVTIGKAGSFLLWRFGGLRRGWQPCGQREDSKNPIHVLIFTIRAELALNGQGRVTCYVGGVICWSPRVNNSVIIVSIVSMLACLFLVSRTMPGRNWPMIIAATLAVILIVVFLEQNGYWPSSWKVNGRRGG